MTNKAPQQNCGYGNALVFDLATWHDRIPPDAIVPGCVGPLTFGKTQGFVVYIWGGISAEGEQRLDYVVPKRLPSYNKIPNISDYDPRECAPVLAYLRRAKRAKDPAAVAAYASWRRAVFANRQELQPPFMLDLDDAEFYCHAHDRQSSALPRTPKIAAEETVLKAGYRKRSKYQTAFQAERVYVTSACDTEVYARLSAKTWTKVAASHFDVRHPETVKALRALGLASKGFEQWVLARETSHGGTYAGRSNIARKISDAMRDAIKNGEQPVAPREPWDEYAYDDAPDDIVKPPSGYRGIEQMRAERVQTAARIAAAR